MHDAQKRSVRIGAAIGGVVGIVLGTGIGYALGDPANGFRVGVVLGAFGGLGVVLLRQRKRGAP